MHLSKTIEAFETTCEDGVVLKGKLLMPDQTPRAVIQFNGGTATKKEFYLDFLNYFVEQGYIVCLWDYRGSGDSAPQNLADCDFRFADYGMQDMPAIKTYLKNRFPDLPLLLLAHSVGGQQVGFAEELNDYIGMVAIAVSAGYYYNMPLNYRLQALFFFYLFIPISNLLKGFVVAKPFKLMENLPYKVAKEWGDWCAKPTYFFDEKFYGKTVPQGNYKNLPFPIHVFWTPDDTISNEQNTMNLWKNIQSTHTIHFSKISPEDMNVKQIGHFGFFKKKLQNRFWNQVLSKLEEFLLDYQHHTTVSK